jgi:hypothetical protein
MSAFPGVKATAAGASAPITVVIPENVMWQAAPAYSLGLVCTVSAGASLTYSVQVTADPIPSVGGNWNNHDIVVNQTASISSNIAYPVTGVRLNVSSYTNGSVNLGVAYWP